MKQKSGCGLLYYACSNTPGKTEKYGEEIKQNCLPVGRKSKQRIPGLEAGVSTIQS
jgi:hypothetical protein